MEDVIRQAVMSVMLGIATAVALSRTLRARQLGRRVRDEQDRRVALEDACSRAIADVIDRQRLCAPECPAAEEMFDDRTIAIAERNWKLLLNLHERDCA